MHDRHQKARIFTATKATTIGPAGDDKCSTTLDSQMHLLYCTRSAVVRATAMVNFDPIGDFDFSFLSSR